MKKKHNSSGTGRSGIYMRGTNRKNKGPHYRMPDSYRHKPMKLNMIKKRKPYFGKLKFKGKKTSMTYYACDKPGHIARNCWLFNKMQWPQISMFLRLPAKLQLR